MKPFDHQMFNAKRKTLKTFGWVALGLGLLTIVDMSSNFPIPLTGVRAILTGLALIIVGMVLLYRGYKLPLQEAMDWIYSQDPGTGVSVSHLVENMRVDRNTAGLILNCLHKDGYLRGEAMEDGEYLHYPSRGNEWGRPSAKPKVKNRSGEAGTARPGAIVPIAVLLGLVTAFLIFKYEKGREVLDQKQMRQKLTEQAAVMRESLPTSSTRLPHEKSVDQNGSSAMMQNEVMVEVDEAVSISIRKDENGRKTYKIVWR